MASVPSIPGLFRTVASRRGQIVRVLAADSKRSFWALSDQMVASFGSFGVNILLGRTFQSLHQVGKFGDYWTIMELMIFLNGLQGALIIYPLTLRGAVNDGRSLARMTGMSLLLTLLLGPLFAVAIFCTALAAGIPLAVGRWAAVALVLWQIQETTRRALMAHLRFRAALLGDFISFAGQVLVVWLLAWYGRLTLVTAFQAIGFTSMIASIVQMAQLKLQPACADDLPGYGHECWDLGRWMLIGNLTNFVIGPLYAWNLRFCLGETLMGVNYALSNVLRIANPLAFAVASMIVPHASSTYQFEGIARARRVMLRFGGLGALLLAPYLGFVFLFPATSIGLVYGFDAGAYVRWAPVLRISAIATGLMYAGIVTGAFLNGAQSSKLATVGQFVYAAAAMCIAMPCVALFGLFGVPIGWVIAAAILLCTNLHFIFKICDPAGLVVVPTPQSDQPPVHGLDTIAPAV